MAASNSQLLARIAAQDARIAALEMAAQTAPAAAVAPIAPTPPKPYREEGAQIFAGSRPRIALPSDAEYRRLREIVNAAYGMLMFTPTSTRYAEADEAADHHAFKVCFAYIAELARSDQLAHKYSATWWADGARIWAEEGRVSATITVKPFLAALVAHADVAFTALDDFPSFGLSIGSRGRQYGEAWRGLLSGGSVLAPVALPGRPSAPIQHTFVRQI